MTADRDGNDILVVGGYGEVGRRIGQILEEAHPGRVVVAGRHPERAVGLRARRLDVDDPSSIDAALGGIAVVVVCVRQIEPHLLAAAVRRGIAYTSTAPPWMSWPALAPLHDEAQRTGARIIVAAGLEPGISSVLARFGADRLPAVDAVETALVLGVGDAYGPNSLVFLFEELAERYSLLVDGTSRPARAFGSAARVTFPAPIGSRRVYTMPFRDQLYYPMTLGARTSIARLGLDPPWLGTVMAALARLGAGAWSRRGNARGVLHRIVGWLRRRHADRRRFALLVEVRGGGRIVRSTLLGAVQAQATAVGTAAIAEALYRGEVTRPGVWLAEQVIAPAPFLARLAEGGLVPVTEELASRAPTGVRARRASSRRSPAGA
jgi:saccharopine dehydrogenase (NAD+, L-lysine-forming)